MNELSAVSLELAQAALRLEHLAARADAANIARTGAGGGSYFALNLDAAYDALRAAARSPAAAVEFGAAVRRDAEGVAGLHETAIPAGTAADDLVLGLSRSASRYQALAEAIGRQYGLLTLAIRGAR